MTNLFRCFMLHTFSFWDENTQYYDIGKKATILATSFAHVFPVSIDWGTQFDPF